MVVFFLRCGRTRGLTRKYIVQAETDRLKKAADDAAAAAKMLRRVPKG